MSRFDPRNNDFGYTTPKRAADTLRDIREQLSGYFLNEADRFRQLAERLGSDGLPPVETSYGNQDPLLPPRDIPDMNAARKAILAYGEAAKTSGPVVNIPLEDVRFAKELLGRYREHTIVVGMDVEWIANIEGGEWERRWAEGGVIAICDGQVAVGHVMQWRHGGGSSERGLTLLGIEDLRTRQPDIY